VESAFPTLKRGANKHCASGALIWTLLIQPSINPRLLFAGNMRGLKFHPSDEDLSLGTPATPRLPPELFLPQGLKPVSITTVFGTTEVVP